MHSRQFIIKLVLAAAFFGPGRGVLVAQQADTTRSASPGQAGPTNPRLLPDVSVVGDLIFDLSPKGSTQESGKRFGVREIEVALRAAVDPYFRGDIYFVNKCVPCLLTIREHIPLKYIMGKVTSKKRL